MNSVDTSSEIVDPVLAANIAQLPMRIVARRLERKLFEVVA
jgi:hypothetical protein